MKAKLVKILLDHDVTFTKEDPNFVNTKGFCLSGFSVMSQRVYGNSKEEILQKMYEKEKMQKKEIEKYNALPYKKTFLDNLLDKNKLALDRKYKVRCTEKTNEMDLLTESKTGQDWLEEKWRSDYTQGIHGTEVFTVGGFSYDITRNSLEVDWNLWGKYKKLVDKWEDELKANTNESKN